MTSVLVPAITMDGTFWFLPALGQRVPSAHCVVRGAGAIITVAHPGAGAPAMHGALALEWTGR